MTRKQYELLTRARNAYHLEDFTLAKRLLKKIENAGNPEVLITLGTIYLREEENKKAIEAFKNALELSPGNPHAMNNLGVLYGRTGQTRKAIDALSEALESDPDQVDVVYNLGNLYKEIQNSEKAIYYYKKAISLENNYIRPYNNLGVLYEKMGLIPEAINVYQEGLRFDTNNPNLHFNLGIALEKENELEEAEKEYKKALKYKPDWIPALNNIGIIKQKKGNPKRARDYFSRILNIDPNNQEARNNLAIAENQEGKVSKALEILLETIKDNPGYKRAEDNISEIINNQEAGEDISSQLLKASELFPKNVDIQLKTSKTLLESGNLSDSEKVLNRIIEIEPEHSDALSYLTKVYQKTGRLSMARSCITQQQSNNNENPFLNKELARISRQQKDYASAVEEIERFLKDIPEDRDGLYMLADLRKITEGDLAALSVYRKILEYHPEDSHALSSIAEISQKLGNKGEALSMVRKLVDLQSSRGSEEDINQLASSLEIYEQAVRAYEDDTRSAWERNLGILTRMAKEKETSSTPQIQNQKEELHIPEVIPEEPIADESLSIIDIGAMEPNLEINEEEDTLYFSEEEDDSLSSLEFEESSLQEENTTPEDMIEENHTKRPPPEPDLPQQPYMPLPVMVPPMMADENGIHPMRRKEDFQKWTPERKYSESNHPNKRKGDVPPPPSVQAPSRMEPVLKKAPDFSDNNTPWEEPAESPSEEEPMSSLKISNMLEYLKDLAGTLPEEKQEKYQKDEIPLKMEYLRNRLEKKTGLKDKGKNFDRRKAIRKESVTLTDLEKTMKMMGSLAEFIPDSEVGSLLKKKTSHILEKISKEEDHEQTR